MSKGGNKKAPPVKGLDRRTFLKGMGTGLIGTATIGQGILAADAAAAQPAAAKGENIEKAAVTMTINGKKYTVEVEPREVLLEVLREKLQLTGAKLVCGHGECGACTVILNGRIVYSCLMLAIEADGAKITTIEGLGQPGNLHPVQKKFIEHDAYQCGFCTPGFEVALADLLEKNPKPTLEDIKRGLAGNICRCGAHPHIFNAALDLAAGKGGR